MTRNIALLLAPVAFAAGLLSQPTQAPGQARQGSALEAPARSMELDIGTFAVASAMVSNPIGFVWVRSDGNGGLTETWLLYDVGQTDGWQFPGSGNPDVTISIAYKGDIAHTDLGDFKAWAVGEFDPAVGASTSDFETHVHDVTIQ